MWHFVISDLNSLSLCPLVQNSLLKKTELCRNKTTPPRLTGLMGTGIAAPAHELAASARRPGNPRSFLVTSCHHQVARWLLVSQASHNHMQTQTLGRCREEAERIRTMGSDTSARPSPTPSREVLTTKVLTPRETQLAEHVAYFFSFPTSYSEQGRWGGGWLLFSVPPPAPRWTGGFGEKREMRQRHSIFLSGSHWAAELASPLSHPAKRLKQRRLWGHFLKLSAGSPRRDTSDSWNSHPLP